MSRAPDICTRAAELVAGDRARQHGNKRENFQNIAAQWNAFLGWRLDGDCKLTPCDVALMMVLMKVARTKTGEFNEDDFIDMAGYAGCAVEVGE